MAHHKQEPHYTCSEAVAVTDIEWFFREYVFGFMYHDIDAAICGRANFLAALGLLEYTEFMGGLVIGELGTKTAKNRLKDRFDAFLHRMGDEYKNLPLDVYDVFRCGLAHEYFAKGFQSIRMYNRPPQPCGIVCIGGQWLFIVEKYYDDFKTAVGSYYAQLVAQDRQTISNFRQVVHIGENSTSGHYYLN